MYTSTSYHFILQSLRLLLILVIVLSVWSIVINWRVYKRLGTPGWKSLIPIYNVYVTLKQIGAKTSSFVVYFVLLSVSVLSSLLGFGALIALLPIYEMSLHYRMSKFLGESTVFSVGAAIFWIIFGSILAFEKKQPTPQIARPAQPQPYSQPIPTPDQPTQTQSDQNPVHSTQSQPDLTPARPTQPQSTQTSIQPDQSTQSSQTPDQSI